MKNMWKKYEENQQMETGMYLVCYSKDDTEDQYVELLHWYNEGDVISDDGYGLVQSRHLPNTPMVKINRIIGKYSERIITKSGFYDWNLFFKDGAEEWEYQPMYDDIHYYIKINESCLPFNKPFYDVSKENLKNKKTA